MFVSGWGAMHENDHVLPDKLRVVDVPIVDRSKCNKTYLGEISIRMICAGLEMGGKDSCQGDSGGPAKNNGTLAGIVSWGRGCAEPHYPGVYTNVARFVTWIKQKMSQKS